MNKALKKHENIVKAPVKLHAAAITLLLHILVFILFVLPTTDLSERFISSKHIRMLNTDKIDNTDLEAALNYGDPRSIADPLKSFVSDEKTEFKLQNDVALVYQTEFKAEVPAFENMPVSNAFLNENNAFGTASSLNVDKAELKKEKSYPFVFAQNGLELAVVFDSESEITEILKDVPSINYSTYKVTIKDGDIIPRVVITDSCGKRKLDHLALRPLIKHFSDYNVAGSFYVTVSWRKPGGER